MHSHGYVIAICGDGGLQIVLGELTTAMQYRLPIIVIVFNNGLLHNVSAQQPTVYDTALHNPDFVALSRAFGADGAVVDGTTDVDAVLQQAMAQRTTPFVIDLLCNPRIPPPLSTWESALFGRQVSCAPPCAMVKMCAGHQPNTRCCLRWQRKPTVPCCAAG